MKGTIFGLTIAAFFFLFSSCLSDSHRAFSVGPGGGKLLPDGNGMAKGRELAINQCGECHRFYFPKEYSSQFWENILKQKSDRLSLATDETAALTAYFKSEGSKR